MKKLRYSNIFIYSSLQFAGNIEEYFSRHSEKLVVFIILPRLKNKVNYIRLYKKGKLAKEIKVRLAENIFLYYLLWYVNYIRCILLFEKKDKILVLGMHPITFFGMTMQKFLRNITFAFWICDYFPGGDPIIKTFEALKKYYHDRMPYTFYLSDGINKVFNKKIITTPTKRSIMWGVKPIRRKKLNNDKFTILFVGLIKDSQGIEFLLEFLKTHKNYFVNIIGICNKDLYEKYQQTIKKNKIEKNIYFPNVFYSNEDLFELSRKCDVGIALYNADKSNPTYYTDPGKVKAYAEMGLPVIMTDVSGIAPYIKRFNAGILVSRDKKELGKAFVDMRRNYTKYKKGIEKFNKYFYFEEYYKKSFFSIENL